MTTREWTGSLAPHRARTGRRAAARFLRLASMSLGRLALRLLPAERRSVADPVLEFYADAGAPEGALYVDGELVARLRGVSRL